MRKALTREPQERWIAGSWGHGVGGQREDGLRAKADKMEPLPRMLFLTPLPSIFPLFPHSVSVYKYITPRQRTSSKSWKS